jgi:acyl-CoA hydrolase
VILGSDPAPPFDLPVPEPTDVHRAIGERVAALVPEGAHIQFGPGQVGNAVCESLTVPVHVNSGLLGDAVAGIDRRGLLLGEPTAAYLAGTAKLYDWAPGRAVLHPVDRTHNPVWQAGLGGPFVAINTALEIDVDGQVNVEAAAGSTIGGIGGHHDFCFSGTSLPGSLSIIAVPSRTRSGPTLVEHLAGPVSTPSHDIDIVVTDHGTADLRGLDRRGRRSALAALWEQA